jgi:hypothetical protein
MQNRVTRAQRDWTDWASKNGFGLYAEDAMETFFNYKGVRIRIIGYVPGAPRPVLYEVDGDLGTFYTGNETIAKRHPHYDPDEDIFAAIPALRSVEGLPTRSDEWAVMDQDEWHAEQAAAYNAGLGA